MVGDHSRQMKKTIFTVGEVGDGFRSRDQSLKLLGSSLPVTNKNGASLHNLEVIQSGKYETDL